MSHANLSDIKRFHKLAKKLDIRLGLDTEGAQIRTKLKDKTPLILQKNELFTIHRNKGDKNENDKLSLYPEEVLSELQCGDKIRLDFDGASVEVIDKNENQLTFKCDAPGNVGDNKGADCYRPLKLPDFTKKDLEALRVASELGIKEIFISFCKSTNAINKAREIVKSSIVTSKIESRLSINSLASICNKSDAILIDRGDLSREINILDIPFAQRGIVQVAKEHKTPCYVATNVLESLITGDLPSRAELNDIVSTLQMGASGIVLAAESAIGKNPVLCAEIVRELMHRFELNKSGLLFADVDRNEITDSKMRIWLNR